MFAAVQGFATIWAVIGVGWLVAHLELGNQEHQRFLSRFAFRVASPALLFMLVSKASLQHVFGRTMPVSALAIVSVFALYWLYRLLSGQRGLAAGIMGNLASGYTNAGNLGLPIAAYVLGDMTWMATIILMQVGLIQPVSMMILDVLQARERQQCRALSLVRCVRLLFHNPMTNATLLGIVANLSGFTLPSLVEEPLKMLSAMAVPIMLISFGMALRLNPLPGKGPHLPELVVVVALKVVAHPVIAYLIGWAFGLSGHDLLSVTVMGALPTAQNVFIVSSQYRVQEDLVRDAIFWSTILTIPTIIAIATVLG